ncbi:MAG: alpha/beta hydrolase fold domain-containing protein [Armatimonadota bacterium]
MNRRTLLLTPAALALSALGARAAEPRVEQDVLYGEPDGYRLLMDIYRPEGTGPHPAVLLIHGGGWIGGNKSGYRETGLWLARNGYAACAVGYRLAPQFPYPAAFDDCQRAVRWVRAHAGDYGIDPRRVAAMGASAGAHLAALIGVRKARDNSDRELARFRSRPEAVVALYGAHELVRMWKIEMAHRPLTAWLGGSPEERKEIYRITSPASMVTREAPPFLIIHGDADTVNPEEQSHLLHDALRGKGVESKLLILEGAGHGWPADSPHARQADAATLEFLGQHLRRKK